MGPWPFGRGLTISNGQRFGFRIAIMDNTGCIRVVL